MGRSPCCDKIGLKKGPWTPEEDQKLLAYIEEHGNGSWRALPLKAGLQRCGKSCRLRWTNYLRPDIKRGKFSLQEEQTIIQLHALLGNRWSAIATHLPKRTDNEIKNYWNTHLKKRLTKMGIDPVSHKPKNDTLLSSDGQSKSVANLSHMAQWESARLEAEARLVKQSKVLSTSPKLRSIKPSSTSIKLLAPTRCLDILEAWNKVRGNKHNDVSGECEEEWEYKDENELGNSIPGFDGISMPSIENKNEHVPNGNFLDSFTDLLLSNSSTINHRGGDSNDLEPSGLTNGCYEDNNKNYWNNILDLVNSSLQDPPLF